MPYNGAWENLDVVCCDHILVDLFLWGNQHEFLIDRLLVFLMPLQCSRLMVLWMDTIHSVTPCNHKQCVWNQNYFHKISVLHCQCNAKEILVVLDLFLFGLNNLWVLSYQKLVHYSKTFLNCKAESKSSVPKVLSHKWQSQHWLLQVVSFFSNFLPLSPKLTPNNSILFLTTTNPNTRSNYQESLDHYLIFKLLKLLKQITSWTWIARSKSASSK